ncbi:MAG: hypothetical protein ACREYE_19180 [Gammaproteobacteria bacterium]
MPEIDTVTTRPLLLLIDDDPIIVDALGLVLDDSLKMERLSMNGGE